MRPRARADRRRLRARAGWRERNSLRRSPHRARRRARVARLGRSWHHEVAELVQTSGADTRDGVELVDGAERAVLRPIVEDLLRSDRPNSRKRIELLEGCGAELYGRGRRAARAAGPACGGWGPRGGSAPWGDHLLPLPDRSRPGPPGQIPP